LTAEIKRNFLIIISLSLAFAAVLCPAAGTAAQTAINYDVAIEGVKDKSLRGTLESVSNTFSYKNKPPATLSLLEHRARMDIPDMLQALKSAGYYEAEIDVRIDDTRDPPLVTFHVKPGPVFRLESVKIELTNAEGKRAVKLPSLGYLGLDLKDPARARDILDARDKIMKFYKELGYPIAKIEEQRVVVDHETKLVSAVFKVDTGPAGYFGQTTVTGLKKINIKFVTGLLPWREGDRYNFELISKLQKRLIDTRIFSLVQIKQAEALDERERLPITIDLKERDTHTISGGLTYHTDEGPGAKISWEDRSLFDGGELLRIQAGASGIGYSGEVLYKEPQFLRNDQTMAFTNRLAYDQTNAYNSRNLDSAIILEREFRPGIRLGLGPAVRAEEVDLVADPLAQKRDFILPSFRAFFNLDTTKNLLDPTRGGRLEVQLAPYFDVLETHVGFVRGRVSYSHYVKISDEPFLLFAGRAALGSIVGAERDEIPADLRFYSGGGGSVRGFAYQLAGPLLNNDPIGGRSVLEISTELRTKITDKIGLVFFLDGGSAFEPSLPDLETAMRWGAGIGGRYYTPIGPLRLDVGVPLNPRPGVDDSFQVYVSIGQAF